jgi:ADP-heptose:LPS heptosyltransferase
LLASHAVSERSKVVAVHPWTSHPKKQWPLDRFAGLIARLGAVPNVAVVVVGGQEEQGEAARLLEVHRGRAINLVGQLSLRQLAACLKRAAVLVSNDSGPVHVAAAVGTPAVVLFGTTDPAAGPRRWGPWGQGHTVICRERMDQITVDEVFQALQPYLR